MSFPLWRTAAALAILFFSCLEFSCSSSPKAPAAAVSSAPAASESPADKTGSVAANFTLKDAAGKDIKLADYKGKVVLLNFWATWCGPCKVEIPWFMEFNKTYGDRGFAVVGVSMDDDGWKSVKPYVAEKKLDYAVVIGNDDLGKLYGGVDSLPTTFIIDRSGKIAYVHMGLEGKDTYQKEILALLDRPVTVAMR
jgi:peroxiredoxin